LRFGLAGTGYWASHTHAPALATCPGIELAAVWGRNAAAAAGLAARHGAVAYEDFDALVADVDAVAFAVPPDVQAGLAVRAAAAGRHLLLEKPLATSDASAQAVADAAAAAGVATVVFFTARFQADVRAWLAAVRGGGWSAGSAVWLGTSLRDDSPYNTAWRREKGGLWDLGPHLVSLLWASLGPVTGVTADAGPGDVTYLILHHEAGPTSVVTVSQGAGPDSAGSEAYLWGPGGRSAAPPHTTDPGKPLRVALTELAAAARSGAPGHECDADFAVAVGHVLTLAQDQIGAAPARPRADRR